MVNKKLNKVFNWVYEQMFPPYKLVDDEDFQYKLREILKAVLSEDKYKDLMKLDMLSPVIWFGRTSTPFLAVTVNTSSELELERCKACIADCLLNQLYIHTKTKQALISFFDTNKKLQMPCIVFRYSENNEQRDLLLIEKRNIAKRLMLKHKSENDVNG